MPLLLISYGRHFGGDETLVSADSKSVFPGYNWSIVIGQLERLHPDLQRLTHAPLQQTDGDTKLGEGQDKG